MTTQTRHLIPAYSAVGLRVAASQTESRQSPSYHAQPTNARTVTAW
jgi:hypothetical protein